MNDRKQRVPKLLCHKGAGNWRGYVNHNGKRHYLKGKYTDKGADAQLTREYKHFLANLAVRLETPMGNITVGEVLEKYIAHVFDLKLTNAVTDEEITVGKRSARNITRRLLDAFHPTMDMHPADVGVSDLVAIREYWINTSTIKVRTLKAYWSHVRAFIRYGISRGLFPPTLQQCVEVLPRITTREYPKLKPGVKRVAVTIEQVQATLPHLSPMHQAMISVQMATGMRPGELCAMAYKDIDTTGELWVYEPPLHKMAYKGKERKVFLSADVQMVIKRWQELRPLPDSEYLFTPREAWILGRQKSLGSPLRVLIEGSTFLTSLHTTPKFFHQAIKRACKAGGVLHWTPYQCRHFFAKHMLDCVTSMFIDGKAPAGAPIEAVGSLLGHSNIQTTKIYTGENNMLAAELTMRAQSVVKQLLG